MTVGARQVATSSVLLLVENLIRLTTVVAISFWIARQLGPDQFGILNFASAFVAIFFAIAALGMETPLILRLTQTQTPGVLVGTALYIRSIFSLVIFGIAVSIAFFLKGHDILSRHVTLVACLCILGCAPIVFDCWFKAKTSAHGPVLARTITALLGAAAKAACLVLGLGVLALAWTVALEAAMVAVGLFLVYRWFSKGSARDALSVDRQLISPLLRESMPYLWTTVGFVLYMKIDVVMLGTLTSSSETGIYSLAQKLSEVLYVIPIALIDSAYPSLAKRFLSSDQTDSQHGQMLFDLAVGGSLLATLVAVVLAGPVIGAIFGSSYLPSVNIFYVHAWSCVAIAMNTARHRWMAALGLQRYAPIVTFIGLIINVAMNFVLIPAMGAMGAAIATVASYFISGYLMSFLIPPLREIGRMQTRALWPVLRLYAAATLLWKKNRDAN